MAVELHLLYHSYGAWFVCATLRVAEFYIQDFYAFVKRLLIHGEICREIDIGALTRRAYVDTFGKEIALHYGPGL